MRPSLRTLKCLLHFVNTRNDQGLDKVIEKKKERIIKEFLKVLGKRGLIKFFRKKGDKVVERIVRVLQGDT